MASPVSIPTLAGGALKGALRLTPGATRVALLLHPHPSYGGNMDNPVLSIGEESLCRQGYATLRFNFNTVGKSGVSDGSSEIQDVQAALQFLREKTSQDTKVILFGYSFGCGVGFEFARLYPKTVEAMVAVAPAPENIHKFSKPLVVIAGAHDSIFPLQTIQQVVVALALPSLKLHVLPKADHFFGSKEDLQQILNATSNFVNGLSLGSTL